MIVPRVFGDSDGASVVVSGSGITVEVVGAGKEIVISDTAGVCESVLSIEGVRVVSGVGVGGLGVSTGDGVSAAGVDVGIPKVNDPMIVVCPSVEARSATPLLPSTFAASPLSVHSTTTPFV